MNISGSRLNAGYKTKHCSPTELHRKQYTSTCRLHPTQNPKQIVTVPVSLTKHSRDPGRTSRQLDQWHARNMCGCSGGQLRRLGYVGGRESGGRRVRATTSELETEKLSEDVRESLLDAVEQSGNRVTVGDVASSGGLKVETARVALVALATDTGATLQVSEEGEIVYIFDQYPRSTLAAKSFAVRIRPLLLQARVVGGWLGRVLFGVSLFASIIFVFTLLWLISAIANKNTDSPAGDINLGLNPFDIYWVFTSNYDERREERKGKKMSFLESIFSFVFGDGDPNREIEKWRWENIGALIRSKGGVVTAEHLAPYTDKAEVLAYDGEQFADESFVLPVLQQFNGVPQVDPDGRLFYIFPDLQTSGGDAAVAASVTDADDEVEDRVLVEKLWKFSAAGRWQIFFTFVLGALNLYGVVTLSMLFDWNPLTFAQIFTDKYSSAFTVKMVSLILPALQLYAASFFVIPGYRLLRNFGWNSAIEARNVKRAEAALAIADPSPYLSAKLASAAAASRGIRIIQDSEIVFGSDRDAMSEDNEGREFDRRLKQGSQPVE